MHQWRVISIVVVTLVNFHAIFMCLEIFYQSNLPFTSLDFTQSGINSLETTCILSHILAWGKVQIGSNQVRSPHCRALKYDTFLFVLFIFTCAKDGDGKYLWSETIGIKLESAFHRKIM